MDFKQILDLMVTKDVSDIFLRANSALKGRIYANIEMVSDDIVSVKDVENIVDEITSEEDKKKLDSNHSCEFTYWYRDNWRFRIGIFYQRNTPVLAIRKIDLRIPSFEKLNLPSNILERYCREKRGMVLLTGITGSGKSTTIASMIQHINNNFGYHILTIEEPIESTFKDNLSVINQREIGNDVLSYEDALKQATLHSPDVIYIGNIRDASTCHAALSAAETGILVFSTIHTINATSTIERIINFFPPHQHKFINNQLSFLLKGVFSQRLIPRCDEPGLIPAYESMYLSPSISRLIRENKFWEIPQYIASGELYGMNTFNQCLLKLAEAKKILPKVALDYSDKREDLEMELRNRELL
ncbi:MAG: PilT/PilU family type 4a pilus ATPase [Candidatus Omnitrophica bacterium]|nr:PilT/PilU family type 4a pilus ATPase [Candidatus Omnitrophota bacterium]MBD3269121.1 PilT/PilU family type 4a pilus ATPase [Candidatus Omnitrophota bacterium]